MVGTLFANEVESAKAVERTVRDGLVARTLTTARGALSSDGTFIVAIRPIVHYKRMRDVNDEGHHQPNSITLHFLSLPLFLRCLALLNSLIVFLTTFQQQSK